MLRFDKTALICDLAETYGVLDYKALPVSTLAALASGLRDDSRIKLKLAGDNVSAETLLYAMMVDRLSLLVWMQTKDAQRGHRQPKSIAEAMITKQTESNIVAFASGEDFEKAWAAATGGN